MNEDMSLFQPVMDANSLNVVDSITTQHTFDLNALYTPVEPAVVPVSENLHTQNNAELGRSSFSNVSPIETPAFLIQKNLIGYNSTVGYYSVLRLRGGASSIPRVSGSSRGSGSEGQVALSRPPLRQRVMAWLKKLEPRSRREASVSASRRTLLSAAATSFERQARPDRSGLSRSPPPYQSSLESSSRASLNPENSLLITRAMNSEHTATEALDRLEKTTDVPIVVQAYLENCDKRFLIKFINNTIDLRKYINSNCKFNDTKIQKFRN